MLTALAIALLLGPWFIRRLQAMQIAEKVRDDGPATHAKKAGTPTMGGSLILLALVSGTALWCDLRNAFIWVTLLVTVGYGAIGFLDDYLKLTRHKDGLPGRVKLAASFAVALGALAILFFYAYPMAAAASTADTAGDIRFRLALPLVDFYKHPITLGWNLWSSTVLYLGFGMFVIAGASHAVNLTDGLDGLASGPIIVAAGAFLVLCYGAGAIIGDQHFNVAQYLKIPFIPGSGSWPSSAPRWWARSPASSGTTRTRPRSSWATWIAVARGRARHAGGDHQERVHAAHPGRLFVAEALSVMLQVSWFKYTRRRYGEGRRIFRMTPLHHHFEKAGLAETRWWCALDRRLCAGAAGAGHPQVR